MTQEPHLLLKKMAFGRIQLDPLFPKTLGNFAPKVTSAAQLLMSKLTYRPDTASKTDPLFPLDSHS
jgi:hypothetical protein